MVKLTKRAVDALAAGKADLVLFDDELAGFGVRVKPSGAKSWLIQYRNRHGRSRRLTLGPVTKLAPEEARKKARKLFVEIADGADPADRRAAMRGAVTVAQLCDDYLAAGKGRIKASTLTMDRSRIERHVKPALGTRAVASLTPADLEKFMRDVMAGKTVPSAARSKAKRGGKAKGGPSVASRALGMLGTILERAVRDGILASNPARKIARPKDNSKRPLFSFDALEAVGTALRDMETEGESRVALAAIRTLLLTGWRRMEGLTVKTGMLDAKAHCVRFADTKSGPQVRAVGRSAFAALHRIIPADAPAGAYVFPGSSKAGHFVGLPKVWDRVAKRAGITGVSLHGLRHWFASAAAEMGYSELIIAALLGHRVKGVTARYANAPDSALVAAADRISGRLADALAGMRAAQVVNLR